MPCTILLYCKILKGFKFQVGFSSVLLKVYFHHKSVRQYNIHIKSNNTNEWPPAVGLLPKAQLKGKKEQGAESMKQNTMLLVHHEQKPEQ